VKLEIVKVTFHTAGVKRDFDLQTVQFAWVKFPHFLRSVRQLLL